MIRARVYKSSRVVRIRALACCPGWEKFIHHFHESRQSPIWQKGKPAFSLRPQHLFSEGGIGHEQISHRRQFGQFVLGVNMRPASPRVSGTADALKAKTGMSNHIDSTSGTQKPSCSDI